VRPILTEHALAGRTHVDQRNAEFLVGRDSRNQFISQKTRRSLWQPMAVDGRRVATVERSRLEWRCHFNSDRRCCSEIKKGRQTSDKGNTALTTRPRRPALRDEILNAAAACTAGVEIQPPELGAAYVGA
jgi:hypothetical protein